MIVLALIWNFLLFVALSLVGMAILVSPFVVAVLMVKGLHGLYLRYRR